MRESSYRLVDLFHQSYVVFPISAREIKALVSSASRTCAFFPLQNKRPFGIYPPKNKNKCINLFLFYLYTIEKQFRVFETKKKLELV